MTGIRGCAIAVVWIAGAGAAAAQAPPTLTLEQALQYAIDHYPSVRAAVAQVAASSAGVDLARAAYLPRLDSLWQSNRATANNVFGQLLPQSVIPAMSGPVLPATSAQSVWGSAAGAFFSWEPIDFGLREAGVHGAEAGVARARAAEALTRLDVQQAVASAVLNVVSADRAVLAAQADVERRDVVARVVHTLVDNQLRPGADASRVDAERAAAATRLIQAQTILTTARVTLTRLVGATTGLVAVDPAGLLDRMPSNETPSPPTPHPLALLHQAAIEQAQAQHELLTRTDFPRVYLQSSVFARGRGANPDGPFDGGVDGLGLERANWAAGVQVVFPNLFDFSSLRARKAAADAAERAETALYDEAMLTVRGQQQEADAMMQAARAIAANVPAQLASAQQAESQARARYQSGLASIVELAEAQSLLAQAELQDQLARVDVWRAGLAAAAARGDLTAFVQQLHSSAGGR